MRPEDFRCAECGLPTPVGYAAGKRKDQDWRGKLRPGEWLCPECFRKRGEPLFGSRHPSAVKPAQDTR